MSRRAHARRLQNLQQGRRRMQMLDESPTFITPRAMIQLDLPLEESPKIHRNAHPRNRNNAQIKRSPRD